MFRDYPKLSVSTRDKGGYIDGRFGGFDAGPASQFGPAFVVIFGPSELSEPKKVNITSQKDGQVKKKNYILCIIIEKIKKQLAIYIWCIIEKIKKLAIKENC